MIHSLLQQMLDEPIRLQLQVLHNVRNAEFQFVSGHGHLDGLIIAIQQIQLTLHILV